LSEQRRARHCRATPEDERSRREMNSRHRSRPSAWGRKSNSDKRNETMNSALRIRARSERISAPDVTIVNRARSSRVARSAHDAAPIREDRENHVLDLRGQELARAPGPPQSGESALQGREVRTFPGGGSDLHGVAPAELDDLGLALALERGETLARANGT